jgi:hypothetical protein
MKYIIYVSLFFGMTRVYAQEQKLVADSTILMYEDSMKILGHRMIYDYNEMNRLKSSYNIIKLLVKALKTPNSYNYNFDSIPFFTIKKPEDNTFRIITWQTEVNTAVYRHFGCIQMNTNELKLFPLFDNSDNIDNNIQDTILNRESWIGSVYYRILTQKIKGRPHYFLFGYDAYSPINARKLIEVLTFDKKTKEPIFGSEEIFIWENENEPENKSKNKAHARFILEYKNDATVTLNYDDNLGKIIFDHVEKMSGGFKNKGFSNVPDGTYETFEFKKGKWKHNDFLPIKVMEESPLPKPEN